MAGKTTTKTKTKTGTSSIRPPSRSTRANPVTEDDVQGPGDPALPPENHNEEQAPGAELHTHGEAEDTPPPPLNPTQGSTETVTSTNQPAPETTPADDGSETPRGGTEEPPIAPEVEPLARFQRELSAIVDEADGLFHGLDTQITGCFEAVDKANSYMGRVRREVDTAQRRAEGARIGLNVAVDQFTTRVRRLRAQTGHANDQAPPSGTQDEAPAPPQSPPIGDEDYVGPPRREPSPQPVPTNDRLEQLFEPRRAGESANAYEQHLNGQRQWLAAHPFFRERRRTASPPPGTRSTRSGADVTTAGGGGGPPDGDDDSPDPRRANRLPPRRDMPPHLPRNRGGHGRGRGGGPPGGGPPDDGGDSPGDEDDRTSTDDDRTDRDEPGRADPPLRRPERRHFTRSPSYMPERRGWDHAPAAARARVNEYNPEFDDAFMRESLRAYRALIRDKLGEQLPENTALKNIKNLPVPDKYEGEADAELFEGWLKGLIRWLRIMRLGGRALDEERTQILGQYLKGKAAEWYNDTIDTAMVHGPRWTFSEAVCALFERFLHHVNAGGAADKFYDVKYTKDKGIHGLWDELVKHAQRMPQPPDDYTFARKFVESLPSEVAVPLFRSKNVTVEGTALRTLYHLAVIQEHNNKQADHYRSKLSTLRPQAGSSSSTARPADRRTVPSATRAAGGLASAAPPSGRFVRIMTRAEYDAQRARPTAKTEHSKDAATSIVGRDNTRPAGTTTFNASRPANVRRPNTGTRGGPATKRGCFNCGEVGHFSKDCPHPPQDQFRAARVVPAPGDQPADLSTAETADASNDISTTADAIAPVPSAVLEEEYYDALDGSQYDSDGDAVILDDYVAEDEEMILFGAMRVVEDSSEEPGETTAGDQSGDFATSGMSAVAWELSMLRAHLHAPPGTPYYVDNINVRQLLQRLLTEHVPLNTTSSSNHTAPPSATPDTPPAVYAHDWRGVAQGSWPLPLGTPEDGRDREELMAQAQKLREMALQQHNDVLTLHRELVWTRNEHLNALYHFRAQGDRHLALHRAVTELVSGPVSDYQREEMQHALTTQYEPRPMGGFLPRAQDRFAAQNALFEDMAVDSDSEPDYIDDPTPRRAAEALTDSEPGSSRFPQSDERDTRGADSDEDYSDLPPLEEISDSDDEHSDLLSSDEIADTPSVDPPLCLCAMTAVTKSVGHIEPKAEPVTRAAVRRPTTGRRPVQLQAQRTCLTAYVTINGLAALVLLDSGSTTDSLSPDFARVARAPILELENPAVLQLGCVGSRSRISHGTTVPVMWGAFTHDVYFDIVNLDRYDAVLGTPFMRQFGVCLDFGANTIRMGAESFAALAPREEEAAASRKRPAPVRRAAGLPTPVTKSSSGTPSI